MLSIAAKAAPAGFAVMSGKNCRLVGCRSAMLTVPAMAQRVIQLFFRPLIKDG
jgi:hypothetical protein